MVFLFSLVYFFWEKNKVITTLKNLSTAKNPVTEVSFHPKDRSIVCIVGQGIFKVSITIIRVYLINQSNLIKFVDV